MPQFVLSLHATEQILYRGISEEIVFKVLNNPDKIEEDGQVVYQKIDLFDVEKNIWFEFL